MTSAAKKQYLIKNKEILSEKAKIYYLEKKEHINKRNRDYYSANKESVILRNRLYCAKRRLQDKNYVANKKYQGMLSSLFRKIKSGKVINSKINEITGCSTLELKYHFEKMFRDGMTWQNYGLGGWHIDHIKPRCKFNLVDEHELRVCYHYTNLQPLWEFENRAKGTKL